MSDEVTWPIWFCLSRECKERLKAYQRQHYGRDVDVPIMIEEKGEELERIMRTPAHTAYQDVGSGR